MSTITPGSVRSRELIPDPITITANEPATIYYTIDGTDPDPATTPGHRDNATIRSLVAKTTVKYFAVDTAGNREDVQTATFEQDITAPAPVTGMSVVVTAGTAHVTWTNPTDVDWAGTAIARVTDIVDGGPTDGTIPLLHDSLSGSLEVVSLGQGTSFDEPGIKPGVARYVAWTYDDLGNISISTTAAATVPLGSLTAQLTYNTTTGTLTIAQAPPDIDIATTTAAVAGGTLTVTLVAKNKSSAYLTNPKAEVTAVTGATFTGSDGTADTFPFKSLGANTWAPGVSITRPLTFTTSATTITIDLAFASHPSLIITNGSNRYYTTGALQLIDVGTDAITAVAPLVGIGPGGRAGGRPRAPSVVGGHFLDVPTTHAVIERFDLVTGMPVGVAPVGNAELANVQGLLAVNGGEIAIVKLAQKGRVRYGEDHLGQVVLVRLDEGLHVLQTATYQLMDSSGACQPVLSPDGTTIAIASGDTLMLVDARTLTQIDADPGTPDLDPFVPASTGRIGSIIWLNNTDLFVVARKTGQAALVKRSGGAYSTSLVYNDHTTYQGGFAAAKASDGKVWMSFPATIQVFDPVTATVAPLAGYVPTGPTGTQGVVRVGTDMWIVRADYMTLDHVANDGTILHTITLPQLSPYGYLCSPGCNGVFGHWMQVAQ
jgi:hypothetical protein